MATIIDTTFECEGVNWQRIKNIILGRGKGWPKVCLPFPRNKERKHLPLLLNIIRLLGGFPFHAVDKLNKYSSITLSYKSNYRHPLQPLVF